MKNMACLLLPKTYLIKENKNNWKALKRIRIRRSQGKCKKSSICLKTLLPFLSSIKKLMLLTLKVIKMVQKQVIQVNLA